MLVPASIDARVPLARDPVKSVAIASPGVLAADTCPSCIHSARHLAARCEFQARDSALGILLAREAYRQGMTSIELAVNTILTLHDPERAREYYIEGVWQTDTMYGCLRDHAEARPDSWALRDASLRLTWRELASWVDAVAADLHRAGVKRGQRVSVWLPNRVEAVVVFLACSRNGYVCNPSLHQNYTVGEIVRSAGAHQMPRRCSRSPATAPTRHAHDIFAAAHALARDEARVPPRSSRRGAAGRRDGVRGFPNARRSRASLPPVDQSRQGRLPRVHVRHDRHAEGRAAFGQHAARQRPRHGPRLASRRAHRALSATAR